MICKSRFKQNKNMFLLLIMYLLPTSIFAQTLSVGGKVTSNRFPVKFAEIIFIDNADTTIQYRTLTDSRGYYDIDLITSVESSNSSVPKKFSLGQSYPNPFSSTTAIPYGLNEEANIDVVIYDVLGREVKKFNVGRKSIGSHNIHWNGTNNFGQKVANGIFFYRFIVEGKSYVRKMIFNSSGNNSFVLPGSFSFIENTSLKKETGSNKVNGTNFYIHLRNTSSTVPVLVEMDLKNVEIQNDTTINFYVESNTLAAINLDSTHQTVRGYGAATPWYREPATASEIQSAFGKDDGELGLNILRLTVHPDSNQWYKWVESSKKAYELGAKIIAAPWYAPSNMIERVENRNKIKQDMYNDYVAHLNHFINYMSNNGAPIYGISIQNEPDISEDWTWWDPEDMLRFMRDFADSIEGALVMAPESFQFRKNISDPLLNDSAATVNIDIICGHIYGGGLTSYPLAEEKGKEVWMTEYLIGDNNSANNLEKCIELAVNVNDVMNANMNAYVWWTLIRYYGPIGDGETASDPADPRERYPAKGEVTKKGYVLSHFSKFVLPGYMRVESNITPITADIDISAYKDPNTSKIVIIAVNSATSEKELVFRIADNMFNGTFETYTTSENKNCEKGEDLVVGEQFTFSFEAQSITTFVFK